MKFNKEEKKLLIEAISNEQIKMIIKDHNLYDSQRYIKLESLKVKIKDMWGDFYSRYQHVYKWKMSDEGHML